MGGLERAVGYLTDYREVAWLTGFFDGEGHASVHPMRMKSGTWYQAMASIRNTHKPSVDEVCRILDKMDVKHSVLTEDRGKNKTSYYVQITGMPNIRKFAASTHPHSITKARQLELLVDWCDSRATAKHGSGYSEYELDIAEEFLTLNRRGNPDFW
jgi:LAGLIDADG-like domain